LFLQPETTANDTAYSDLDSHQQRRTAGEEAHVERQKLYRRHDMLDQKNTIWFTVACVQHETSELSVSDQERALRGLSFRFSVDHAKAYWNLVWLAAEQKWRHLYV